jgi:hypothetical protein
MDAWETSLAPVEDPRVEDPRVALPPVTTCAPMDRTIVDTVHGLCTLPVFVWAVLRTRSMQRLRALRQTGMLHLVFMGATHNRFSHSVGTAALAYRLMQHLQRVQPFLRITDGLVNTVVMAALCHDLGHGPCSHSFERFMHAIGRTDWHHEQQTLRLLQHMVDTEPGLAEALHDAGVVVPLVGAIITGNAATLIHQLGPAYGWVARVVHDQRHGNDVDKWDYLNRDAYYLGKGAGAGPGPNVDRLITYARVLQDDDDSYLAWPRTEADTVQEVFRDRQGLHSSAYQHPTVRSVEVMLTQALVAMKDVPLLGLGVTLASAADNLEAYLSVTDWVPDLYLQGAVLPGSPPEAVAIFQAIAQRRLWPCVSEVITSVPAEAGSDASGAAAVDDLTLVEAAAAGSTVRDVVHVTRGMGVRDPIDMVPFYKVVDTQDRSKTMIVPCKRDGDGPCVRICRVYVKG